MIAESEREYGKKVTAQSVDEQIEYLISTEGLERIAEFLDFPPEGRNHL